eukprot:CAMPEP_0177653030 /NCGR_PEP_ID=MMETSP0447-20121125/13491_1 /TAXON_ID=0 /ORGANISM="Stygamoeba regulata, Strain BSH-02190019" /LENGTH=988 /DNA_ID=CAMNT_0019156405 /DNA_START=115 /DNA_END=3081 /DNA_ORIENTATION=-
MSGQNVAFSARPSGTVKRSAWQRVISKSSSKLLLLREETVLEHHFNNSNLRMDEWNELDELCRLISTRSHSKGECGTLDELIRNCATKVKQLKPVENYYAYPGSDVIEQLLKNLEERKLEHFCVLASSIARNVTSHTPHVMEASDRDGEEGIYKHRSVSKPYFEVLVVTGDDQVARDQFQDNFYRLRSPSDQFVYQLVFVNSYQDAVAACFFNSDIQSVIVGYGYALRSHYPLHFLHSVYSEGGDLPSEQVSELNLDIRLGEELHAWRPQIDLFKFAKLGVEKLATAKHRYSRLFFSRQSDMQELHLSVLGGVRNRFNTPFFNALKEYALHPTGVFHALPIARGASVAGSRWANDMFEFYGRNLFLAETSSTSGGLDSLLEPHGPIKVGQELAAKAFGSDHTFWVTNGTSTANKIVAQAICRPGDVVLIDRNAHKSHHYSACLTGFSAVYLDAFPLQPYAMYGGVPLRTIKESLLCFKSLGRLKDVKMLLLTNCTFDGHVYNVSKVMEECLAIHPGLIFLWDEAWYSFARFHPLYRQRTGMSAAQKLLERYNSDDYRQRYRAWAAEFAKKDQSDVNTWLDNPLLPNPDEVKIRVYATQSTHKTLSALRQGSMIHVHDELFEREVRATFNEAFFTHTSTSPNYQILASLDVARRQMSLEGFALVQSQIDKAMSLRKAVAADPEISKYFRFLTIAEMIPAEFRHTGLDTYLLDGSETKELHMAFNAWGEDGDEFVLDPCRLTLHIGQGGFEGDYFKNKILMDRHDIQINKTSINSVLLMTTIGTSRSAVAYFLESLKTEALKLDQMLNEIGAAELTVFNARVKKLTSDLPPLPNFSHFYKKFQSCERTGEGVMRDPFFLGYSEEDVEYIPLDDPRMLNIANETREYVASTFLIPYPPGFPVLSPGVVVSADIMKFFHALDVKEVHGFNPALGLRVFKQEALDRHVGVPKKVVSSACSSAAPRPAAASKPAAKNAQKSAPAAATVSSPASK